MWRDLNQTGNHALETNYPVQYTPSYSFRVFAQLDFSLRVIKHYSLTGRNNTTFVTDRSTIFDYIQA